MALCPLSFGDNIKSLNLSPFLFLHSQSPWFCEKECLPPSKENASTEGQLLKSKKGILHVLVLKAFHGKPSNCVLDRFIKAKWLIKERRGRAQQARLKHHCSPSHRHATFTLRLNMTLASLCSNCSLQRGVRIQILTLASKSTSAQKSLKAPS